MTWYWITAGVLWPIVFLIAARFAWKEGDNVDPATGKPISGGNVAFLAFLAASLIAPGWLPLLCLGAVVGLAYGGAQAVKPRGGDDDGDDRFASTPGACKIHGGEVLEIGGVCPLCRPEYPDDSIGQRIADEEHRQGLSLGGDPAHCRNCSIAAAYVRGVRGEEKLRDPGRVPMPSMPPMPSGSEFRRARRRQPDELEHREPTTWGDPLTWRVQR